MAGSDAIVPPSRAAVPAHAGAVRESARPAAPRADEDSLRDTAVDGAVHLDAAGHALADRDLRRLFDYFLARQGERSIAGIRDDVRRHLRDRLRLDDTAQAQLLAWFDMYVATGQSIAAAQRTGDLRADAALARDLHRHYLGADLAQAWFGADDEYAAYTAQRLALEHAGNLSLAQRSARLDELEASLDPAELAGRHAATDFQIASAQTRDFDVDGTAPDTRFDERAALWGEDAAVRLAALDRQEMLWTQRAADFAQQRDALFADTKISAAAREARLAVLLSRFSEPERRRLQALAQAGALPH